jgi:rhamnosyltransferase
VVVRTRDSAATVLETLRSLRAQTVPVEVLVVDSGSSDGTLDLVAPLCDRLLHVRPGAFSYGGALNVGAAAATAPVHVALSSHCALPRADWVETAVRTLALPGAVATWGAGSDATGRALTGALPADHAYLLAHRVWGLSNHASAWSARAWEQHPFDEHLLAAEDKEWAWRATASGGHVVADPALLVDGGHRRRGGVLPYYRRLVKELDALHGLSPLPPYGPVEAVRDWARTVPGDPALSGARRLGRTRLVEALARWRAARS